MSMSDSKVRFKMTAKLSLFMLVNCLFSLAIAHSNLDYLLMVKNKMADGNQLWTKSGFLLINNWICAIDFAVTLSGALLASLLPYCVIYVSLQAIAILDCLIAKTKASNDLDDDDLLIVDYDPCVELFKLIRTVCPLVSQLSPLVSI